MLYSKEKNIAPVINIPLTANDFVTDAANKFYNNFKLLTGTDLTIERSDGLQKKVSYVLLRINPTQDKNYCIYKKDNNITIQGVDIKSLQFGISEFFETYTSLTYKNIKDGKNDSIVNTLEVPEEFSICKSPDFEYREPYYSNNFNESFRNWNKTNYLELEWGIWGHNLRKAIKDYILPPTIYAEVNGKRNNNQFNFASEELFNAVNDKVKKLYDSDNALNKIMILPNDNLLVDMSLEGIEAGNKKNDASASVFKFINRLAKNHKQITFYTAIYGSVKSVPNFKIEDNVGVFFSTVNIQKGIPIAESESAEEFTSSIKKWSKKVTKIYIWDYTVNFDNYFDLYPILSVAKENFKLYKELGVKGVFAHGSEYKYSTFQELKATVLAKLLWDVTTDVSKEIERYFNSRFSNKLSGILTNYYTFIDQTFLENKKEHGIYSGIKSTTQKYLDPKVFFDFYNEFDLHTQKNQYDKDFLRIATALTFLKLEIMRDYGYGEFGFATLSSNNEIIIKNEVGKLLDNLSVYRKSADLEEYNEVKFTLSDYIDSWHKTIYRFHKRKHYFFKKPFKVISEMDEDYQNKKVLNDGAFGLNDYNTNWHIVTVDDLALEIERKYIEKSTKITMSFLQDAKHNIFYPSEIKILDEDEKLIKKLVVPLETTMLNTREITVNLPTKLDDKELPKTFILKIEKQKVKGKNALACDEIIFH